MISMLYNGLKNGVVTKLLTIIIMALLAIATVVNWSVLTIMGHVIPQEVLNMLQFLTAVASTLLGVHIGAQLPASTPHALTSHPSDTVGNT